MNQRCAKAVLYLYDILWIESRIDMFFSILKSGSEPRGQHQSLESSWGQGFELSFPSMPAEPRLSCFADAAVFWRPVNITVSMQASASEHDEDPDARIEEDFGTGEDQ